MLFAENEDYKSLKRALSSVFDADDEVEELDLTTCTPAPVNLPAAGGAASTALTGSNTVAARCVKCLDVGLLRNTLRAMR